MFDRRNGGVWSKNKAFLFNAIYTDGLSIEIQVNPEFKNSVLAFEQAKKRGITKIICVSVNDPFVMKAWGELHNVEDKIFMAGDPFCKFIKEIGADVDKSEKGLGIRSSRFTMLVENGVVKEIKEESNTANCEISAAENFLKEI